MAKKILILGSSGYIGSNFSNFLNLHNYDVVEFDVKIDSSHDLRVVDNLKLESILDEIDFIYFFAFEIGNSSFIKENDLEFNFLKNNVSLMLNTFSSIKKHRKPVIFISSQMASNSEISYGLLKKMGEKFNKSIGGVNCRIWNVFGGVGQEKSLHVMQELRNSENQENIILQTDGEEMRQFIFMDDLCEMLLKVMIDFQLYTRKDFIDLTSHYWIKIIDLAKIFSNIFGLDILKSNEKAFSDIHIEPTNDFIDNKYTSNTFINKIHTWLKQH